MKRKKNKKTDDVRYQNANKLIVCNESIRKWLTDWIELEGGVFPDLTYFFEQMGIFLPVHLENLDIDKECFQCVDSHNSTYKVSLSRGKPNFSYSLFSVAYGETVSKYCFFFEVHSKYTEPKIFLLGKDYFKNSNILSSRPNSFFMLVEDTELMIKTSSSEFKVLDEDLEFKNFITSVSILESNVSHLFDSILAYIGPKEKIKKDPNFFISAKIRKFDGDTFDSITLSTDSKGKFKYCTSNNGEKFTLYECGEWHYVSERLEAKYSPPSKRYNNKFSFKATGFDPKELIGMLNSLKRRANELMKYFR